MTDITAIVNIALLLFALISVASIAVYLGRISRTLEEISVRLGASGPLDNGRP